jgi:phosphotransferase system IIB component
MRVYSRLVALSLVLGACKGTEAFVGTPTSIAVLPKFAAFSSLGGQRQFQATVLDQRGGPINGAALAWSVDNTAIATVDGVGLVTSVSNGTTRLHVSVAQGSLVDSASISITQVPARLVKVIGDHQGDTISGTLPTPVTVQVNDSADHPVPAIVVNFAVTQGGGHLSNAADTTDASGQASVLWTLGNSPGQNAMSATSAISLTGSPVSFSANAVLAGSSPTLVKNAGDQQVGQIGSPVNFPPSVVILGGGGVPLVGVPVTFAVTSGGGLLTGATAVTDANGVATLGSWVLGAGVNELTATATDTGTIIGNPATFSDSGLAPAYHIDVRFLTTMTTAERDAFTSAASKWESIIFGDVPNVPVTLTAGACGKNPAFNETVDDIVIFAAIDSIDGPGKILGSAGPCVARGGSHLPLVGEMEFDIADVANLLLSGSLDLVIEHEMGHVLGFGTIWSSSLLIDPSQSGGTDPHFVGSQALEAFDRVGGASYVASAKVPVENMGGPGTADGHWRESVFNNELMTGFLDQGVNPLSLVTVASLGDLGYRVNNGRPVPAVGGAARRTQPAALPGERHHADSDHGGGRGGEGGGDDQAEVTGAML